VLGVVGVVVIVVIIVVMVSQLTVHSALVGWLVLMCSVILVVNILLSMMLVMISL